MRKIRQASFGLASMFVAAALVGFDFQIATACSGGGSSSSGLSHGSRMGSNSVTVCVGSSSNQGGSTTSQTITRTVTVPIAPKPKPTPKPVPKPVLRPATAPAPKPVVAPVSCPSPSQLASMPRSADAAERWVQSVCSPAPKVISAPKPVPKPTPKPTRKTQTITITETITINNPGSSFFAADEVQFSPNPLIASVFPDKILNIGQPARFSSNPSPHYGSSLVLGRQAQVQFLPVLSRWEFSDGLFLSGVETQRSFNSPGEYQIQAFVEYEVRYRLLGESAWENVDGILIIESNALEVSVGAPNMSLDKGRQAALLVGADCVGRPNAFGCDI